ncbi:unnamed protein product [Brassica oleracea var. botrytis]|nr:unnamed protein product [Brassica napus]
MPERKPTKMINKTELKSKSRPMTCLKEPTVVGRKLRSEN